MVFSFTSFSWFLFCKLDECQHFIIVSKILHRDESLSGSDITSKLEPAFLSGLRCTQPPIRAKFFEVFDGSMKRRVYERLLYICCSQNWEAMGSHFWIKQCIEVKKIFFSIKKKTNHYLLLSILILLCLCVFVRLLAAASSVWTKHHHWHQLPGIHAAVHHQRHQLGWQPWPCCLRHGNACQAGATRKREQWDQGGGEIHTQTNVMINQEAYSL